MNSLIKNKVIHNLYIFKSKKKLGKKGRNNDNPEYTDHCFTGDYPTNLSDYKSEKIQEQLSLLSENESQN